MSQYRQFLNKSKHESEKKVSVIIKEQRKNFLDFNNLKKVSKVEPKIYLEVF